MLACCAFAVLLLNQLLVPVAFLRERLFGRSPSRPNASATWNPGETASHPPARRFRPSPAFAMILLVEALAVGSSVAAATLVARATPASVEQQLLTTLHASICHVLGKTAS